MEETNPIHVQSEKEASSVFFGLHHDEPISGHRSSKTAIFSAMAQGLAPFVGVTKIIEVGSATCGRKVI